MFTTTIIIIIDKKNIKMNTVSTMLRPQEDCRAN